MHLDNIATLETSEGNKTKDENDRKKGEQPVRYQRMYNIITALSRVFDLQDAFCRPTRASARHTRAGTAPFSCAIPVFDANNKSLGKGDVKP